MPAHRLTAPDDWWQIDLTFHDYTALDNALSESLPTALDPTGRRWWFMRKPPGLRIRIETEPADERSDALVARLAPLLATGTVLDVRATIYEAETAAFGGPAAMNLAHELFHHDARHITGLRAIAPPLGDREISMLLVSSMLRGAGLEGYERGDVWARVAHDRPLATGTPPESITRLATDLAPLLTADTGPDGGLTGEGEPLFALASWFDAFRTLGVGLAALNRTGALERGLRVVLAYHVLFHLNRLGIPTPHQVALVHAGQEAILGRREGPRSNLP